MTTPTMTPDDVADLLRDLVDRSAPATVCSPGLAERVLSQRRRLAARRRLLVGGASALVATTLVAGTLTGHSRYFSTFVPSGAMRPTLSIGDTAVADKELVPQRGDVVVVSVEAPEGTYDTITRVVGLPGDTVACPTNGHGSCDGVTVNGVRLADPYLAALVTAPFPAATVPAGRLFLLGDDRADSNDSRFYSPLPPTTVEGVVVEIRPAGQSAHAVPGAPPHVGPGDDLVDPSGPLPPAFVTSVPPVTP